jgi:hypothetical protein
LPLRHDYFIAITADASWLAIISLPLLLMADITPLAAHIALPLRLLRHDAATLIIT